MKPIDITQLTPEQFDLWRAGYQLGLIHGDERRREQEELEANRLQHQAFRVVRAMAALDSHEDHEAAVRRRTLASAATSRGAA